MSEKAAVHAPIASPSDTTAAADTTASFRSRRSPNRTSRARDSARLESLTSRLASRSCSR